MMKSKLDEFTEVAAAIKAGLIEKPLFSKTYIHHAGDETVIFDKKDAWNFCSSQNLPEVYEYWTGLRETNYAEVLPSRDRLVADKKQKAKLDQISDQADDEIFAIIKSQAQKRGLDAKVADAISTDFYEILKKRVFRAKPHPWAERMFRIYAEGGWPCGWHGKYPEGKLIVFTVA
jgi:hypothetical protein